MSLTLCSSTAGVSTAPEKEIKKGSREDKDGITAEEDGDNDDRDFNAEEEEEDDEEEEVQEVLLKRAEPDPMEPCITVRGIVVEGVLKNLDRSPLHSSHALLWTTVCADSLGFVCFVSTAVFSRFTFTTVRRLC